MATWDILHVRSLEVEHSVPDAEVRRALQEGRLSRDDCVRRPGDERWWRIYEVSEFRAPTDANEEIKLKDADQTGAGAAGAPVEVAAEQSIAPRIDDGSLRDMLKEAEPTQTGRAPKPQPVARPAPVARAVPAAKPARPAAPLRAAADALSVAEAAEEEEGLPYAKRHREEPEELDMTPMVDVAMQLILFFMVTSTMIVQTCLEFPKPAPDESAMAQPKVQTVNDLKTTNIMVKVKAEKAGDVVYVEDEKEPTRLADLSSKIENIKREKAITGGVVVNADDMAYHETVVAVVDGAYRAGVRQIKMAAVTKGSKKAATKKKAIKN